MAQQQLKFGTYEAPPTDQDGYQPQLATTSTANSTRTMKGKMKNTVLFTVEAYQLKWSYIKANEAAQILAQVVNKNEFDFWHFNIYKARWETGRFYAANFNAPVLNLTDGEETLDELSFQVTGTNPIL